LAELPLDQSMLRFRPNENRFDIFINGSATTTYQTSGGTLVPTVQKFLADKSAEINTAAGGILAQTTTAKDTAVDAKTAAEAALASVNTVAAVVIASSGRYWGARTTEPSGAQLGDEYMDISVTPNVRKNLTSTGWKPTSTVAVAGIRRQEWTATAGQLGPFEVTDGFTSGDVYVNGDFRQTGIVFTPGSNGSFTFTAALSAGDLISFRGYFGSNEVDFYTKLEIDEALSSVDGRLDPLESNTAQIQNRVTDLETSAADLDTRLDAAELVVATVKSNGTRSLTVSSAAPTSAQGDNGDVWYQI
jgi:hypothetical protein